MSYRDRFDQKHHELLKRDDIELESYEPGDPVPAASIAKAEKSLGRALPLSLLAFYQSLNGVELKWSHREHRDLTGHITIVPLEVMFGGWHWATRQKWDDTVFEEVIWFDHFEGSDPKTFPIFKQLKPIEFIEGVSMTTALRFAPGAEEPELWLADRWDLAPLQLSFQSYVDWALETGGLYYWFKWFEQPLRKDKGDKNNVAFNRLFPQSPFLDPGFQGRPPAVRPLERELPRKPQTATERLFAALQAGDSPAVRAALDEGADLAATTDAGNTPLHEAARLESHRLAVMLIAAGASMQAKNPKTHDTPYGLATPEVLAAFHRTLIGMQRSGWSAAEAARAVAALRARPLDASQRPEALAWLKEASGLERRKSRPEPVLQLEAWRTLRALAAPDAAPLLLDLLGVPGAAPDALWGLMKVGPSKPAAKAVAPLLQSPVPEEAQLASAALLYLDAKAAEAQLPLLKQALARAEQAGEDPLRDAVMVGLIHHPPTRKPGKQHLFGVLLEQVRENQYLSDGDDREALFALLPRLAPEAEVVTAALGLLAELEDGSRAELLQLLYPFVDTHREAIAALVPELEARLKNTWSPSEAFWSARLLLALGKPAPALAHFKKHLTHDGGFWDITQDILRLLPGLGAAAAPLLPAVKKHLQSGNDTTAKLAAAAQKAIAKAAAKPATKKK